MKLSDLFKGALVNGCEQSVHLKPLYAIKAEDRFNKNIGDYVSIKGIMMTRGIGDKMDVLSSMGRWGRCCHILLS